MRIHATNKLLRKVRRQKQKPEATDKPTGIWYGIDKAWLEWCESEQFATYKYLFELDADPSRILRLSSPDEILAFDAKYQAALPWANLPGMPKLISSFHYIDWAKVAEEYGGIEIAPYQWSLRLDHRVHWYYGWDVASGCIWDPAVIQAIRRVEK